MNPEDAITWINFAAVGSIVLIIILVLKLRPGAKSGMTVEIDLAMLHPGDKFSVRISFLPEKNFHVPVGVVELICMEPYWESDIWEPAFDFFPMQSREREGLRTREAVCLRESFLEDTEVSCLFPLNAEVKFNLPADAPPSSDRTTWRLRTFLVGAKVKDGHQEQELTIYPS